MGHVQGVCCCSNSSSPVPDAYERITKTSTSGSASVSLAINHFDSSQSLSRKHLDSGFSSQSLSRKRFDSGFSSQSLSRKSSKVSARISSNVAEFPTYCLGMSDFKKLARMEAHEDVYDQLLIPELDDVMHFVSHEWLGFSHPDPKAEQLHRMQETFDTFCKGMARQMFKDADWECFLKGVSSGTSMMMRPVEGIIVDREHFTEEDLSLHVCGGQVWLDYHSIQRVKGDHFVKAVNGIPYYVERCDYFWICAPTALHCDLQEQRNFLTWRQRGWCRLEETTNFLSRNLKMPLVMTRQSVLQTFGFLDGLQTYYGRPERSVFNGQFTCCQLGHVKTNLDGSVETMPCDKLRIAPVLTKMFDDFLHTPARDQKYRANAVRMAAPDIFAGGEDQSSHSWLPSVGESLESVLTKLGYTSLDDLDMLGWGPLVWMVSLCDFRLVEEIVRTRPELLFKRPGHGFTILLRSVHLPPERFRALLELYETASANVPNSVKVAEIINTGSQIGLTAVDRAAKHGFTANLETLLAARADPQVRRGDNGATPLLSAADRRYPECVKVLLDHRADVNAADFEGNTPLHLAVDPISVLGSTDHEATQNSISLLLAGRADLSKQNNAGKTAFDVAKDMLLRNYLGDEAVYALGADWSTALTRRLSAS